MSYDILIVAEIDGNEITIDDKNYTSNVNPMFRESLRSDVGINLLQGKTGSEVSGILALAIEDMKHRQEYYEEINPANGWGDYEGALGVLQWLHEYSVEFPSCIIRIY